MTLTIVGLGPGSVDDLSRRAWRVLQQAKTVFLLTSQHPCVPDLPIHNYHSFDDLYEAKDDLSVVHTTIVKKLLEAAQDEDVVYAVPGDPFIGESLIVSLLAEFNHHNIDVKIVHGISFVEPMLASVGVNALDGVQIIDGVAVATMYHPPLNPEFPALIGQVYNRAVASEIKRTLMNQYPDNFPVQLIHGLDGVESIPLDEIDCSEQINRMTSLYVPPIDELASFERFQEIIAHLRAPDGCPWDRKQTHKSLRQYLLEEAYEVLDAIDNEDPQSLAEELGDLLLQIVLHTQIAIDDGEFTMVDVMKHINEKMIRRHPHVFGAVAVQDADEVVTNWEALKRAEKRENGKSHESLLDSIPRALPALLLSLQYQARATKVGFDWPQIDDVRTKLNEELDEVMEVLDNPEKLHDEVGDVLFVIVNWVRWLKIDPENALREANAKFYRRFAYVEQRAGENGRQMTDYTLAELDAFWDEAKLQGL